MRNIKRLPPILFPIWLIIIGVHYLIRMGMWLIGYWWCDDCDRRGNLKTEKYTIKYSVDKFNPYIHQTVHKDKLKHVCGQCYVNHYADSKANVEYVHKIGDKIIKNYKDKEKMTSVGK